MLLAPKSPSVSATEMVQVVLPNDTNPMGFMLGGAVMHLIDIAAAIAAFRHAHELMVTAAVDGLEFLNPIKVGDFIVLKARVTAVFTTSLEVEVTVFSEEALTGKRQMTSRAYLTFVTLEKQGKRPEIPPLLVISDDEQRQQAAAHVRRAEHLARRARSQTLDP
jgi:acyl-CoA hydrolase